MKGVIDGPIPSRVLTADTILLGGVGKGGSESAFAESHSQAALKMRFNAAQP
jgi:hypothetical protein